MPPYVHLWVLTRVYASLVTSLGGYTVVYTSLVASLVYNEGYEAHTALLPPWVC